MSSIVKLTNQLKQLPQDRLSQTVVWLLLIYIASILADITWRLVPIPDNSSQQLNLPNMAKPAASSGDSLAKIDVQALEKLHIFGEYQAVKQPIIEEPIIEATNAPETRLQLTLAATVAEGTGKGTAIIEHAGNQGTYAVSERIGNTAATLQSVYADRVLIDNGGNLETLMLDGVEYDNMNVPHNKQEQEPRSGGSRLGMSSDMQDQKPKSSARAARAQPPQSRDASRSSGMKIDNRNNQQLKRELSKQRDDFAKNPQALLDLIRLSPVRKNGKLLGYRLNPGKDPQLFKQAGFRGNDLAVEVNGYALTDMQQAMSAMREFRTMTEANIIVERNGVQTEILLSLDNAPASEAPRR